MRIDSNDKNSDDTAPADHEPCCADTEHFSFADNIYHNLPICATTVSITTAGSSKTSMDGQPLNMMGHYAEQVADAPTGNSALARVDQY